MLVLLELELGLTDDEATSVAVSVIISSSASLADLSDVSARRFTIFEVMAPRYACSLSSVAPSEDKDSLCFDRRLLFLETVLCRSFFTTISLMPSRSLGAFCSLSTGTFLEVSSSWGLSLIAMLLPNSRALDR